MGESQFDTGESLILVNSVTGEIVPGELSVKRPKGARYNFPGGWALVGLVYISKLADLELPADGFRLALKIMSSTQFGGLCNKSNEAFSKEIGVSKHRVSTLIHKLHDSNVLCRLGPKTMMINPIFFFQGPAKDHNKAIETYSNFRRPELVSNLPRKRA